MEILKIIVGLFSAGCIYLRNDAFLNGILEPVGWCKRSPLRSKINSITDSFWERHHYFTAKGKKRHLCRHFTFCGGHHQRFLRSEYIAAYILQFDLNFQVGSQNLSFSHTLCVCLYSVFNQNTSCALLLKESFQAVAKSGLEFTCYFPPTDIYRYAFSMNS